MTMAMTRHDDGAKGQGPARKRLGGRAFRQTPTPGATKCSTVRVPYESHLRLPGTMLTSMTVPLRIFLPRAPSFRRLLSSRRGDAMGDALWERVEAGSGLLGAASSESAAGSGRLRACGC